MKLIDADELGFELKISSNGYLYVTDNDIINAPTVDAEPVRHGHWIMKKTAADALYTVCSHCNASVKYNDEYGTVVMNLNGANYCPNCGAKMDEITEGK